PSLSRAASPTEAANPVTLSTRLGIIALALGLFAILVLCVPVFGYVSLGLSGIGLILGLAGLFSARKHGLRRVCSPVNAGVQGLGPIAPRDLNYPLGGMLVCLFAATLALLPFLFR